MFVKSLVFLVAGIGIVASIVFFLVRRADKDGGYGQKIFAAYSKDLGVYDIQVSGKHVTIFCITEGDKKRIENEIRKGAESDAVKFVCPIWTIGGLKPENAAAYQKVIDKPESNKPGTESYEKRLLLREKIVREDELIWGALDPKSKAAFIKERIARLRAVSPEAANCGNKFLNKDEFP